MNRQLCLLLACLAVAQAGRLMGGEDILSASARSLLQQTQCPDHCKSGACALDRATNSYKCNDCITSMVVDRASGQCGCAPGRFFNSSSSACVDCPLGSYCPGGIQNSKTSTATAVATACGTGLTTTTRRARAATSCTNLPGYRFVSGTTPSAVLCTGNTYSVGLRKQPSCTPCSSGFVIATSGGSGADARDSPSDCVAPAGYFLKGPGQVAPCPVGEFKATQGNDASCTACGAGITTAASASTSATACSRLVPGVYALTFSTRIDSTKICPQNYFCPGGAATAAAATVADNAAAGLRSCSAQHGTTGTALWTRTKGATSATECMLPPGYSFTFSGKAVAACADGYFREAWTAATALTGNVPCSACASTTALLGIGMKSAAVDELTTYADADGAAGVVNVRGSPDACALQKGYGLYITGTGSSPTYRVQACNSNNYGVAEETFGLAAAPCRSCPTNMVTTTSAPSVDYRVGGAAQSGTAGLPFFDPLACVTQPGFGYEGGASVRCKVGSYNAGNNMNACTECDAGLTTAAAGATASTDCGIAPGYGFRDGSVQMCALDTYNAAVQTTLTTACTACSGNSGSSEVGAASAEQCDVCKAGYGSSTGNVANCADCSATNGFGAPGRSGLACQACPTSSVGFRFVYNGQSMPYTSPAVSRSAASSASDCVSKWAQIEEGQWFLSGATAATGSTLELCQATCDGDSGCQFLSFNYADNSCATYAPSVTTAAAIVAYKATPSGDVSAASVKAKSATSSGMYTQWSVDAGTKPGAATPASVTTKADCLAACDMDAACAAVYMVPSGTFSLTGSAITTCELLKGVSEPGGADASKRSLTRAVPAQFASV